MDMTLVRFTRVATSVVGRCACAALATLALTLPGSAQEQRSAALVAVRDHLQFLGYETGFDDDGDVLAKHAQHWNFYVKEYRGGLLLFNFIDVEAKTDRLPDCHRWANSINANARWVRAYLNSENSLVLEAWLAGEYEKTAFGAYVEAWQEDGGLDLPDEEAPRKCRGE
jgi:hypothetical protein